MGYVPPPLHTDLLKSDATKLTGMTNINLGKMYYECSYCKSKIRTESCPNCGAQLTK